MLPVTAARPSPQEGATELVSMQLTALTSDQVMSVSHLVNLESEKVALERQLKDATGREAAQLRSNLSQLNAAIDVDRAKIENLKSRIAELQKAVPQGIATSAPPAPPGWIIQRTGMFGLNKDEFLGVFLLLLTMPIVLAVSRRLWMKGTPKAAKPSPIEDNRLQRLEQMVEAVAIEVERIGESQRFQAKLMSDKQPEPRRVNTPH